MLELFFEVCVKNKFENFGNPKHGMQWGLVNGRSSITFILTHGKAVLKQTFQRASILIHQWAREKELADEW